MPRQSNSQGQSGLVAALEFMAAALVLETIPRRVTIGLLDTPAEIRNNIYRLICVEDEPINARLRVIAVPHRPKSQFIKRRFPLDPALAQVNRQLRREVLFIFYSENIFRFRHGDFGGPPLIPMTDHAAVTRWRGGLAVLNNIRHAQVELRFRRWDGHETSGFIDWVRPADAPVRIDVKFDDVPGCRCFEQVCLQHACYNTPHPLCDDVLNNVTAFLRVRHIACLDQSGGRGSLWFWVPDPFLPSGWYGYALPMACPVCRGPRRFFFESCV